MPELPARAERPWALRLLPPFPAVANRVLTLVNNDGVAASQIGEIIKLDATFTAEILRVANSALFGAAREITTVKVAVSLLGLDRVKAMATFIAVNSMVKSALRVEALRKFWVHSLVTAILTEQSAIVSGARIEGAHTAGLLHNLGTLGLMAAYSDEYTRMIDVSDECGFDLVRTEQDLFEIDHCAAGACLAREWNFPEDIVEAIAHHHEEPHGELNLTRLVQTTWRLADVLGYFAFRSDRDWRYEELVDMIPGASKSWLGSGIEDAKREVASRLKDTKL